MLNLFYSTDGQGQVVVTTGQSVFGQDHQIIVQTGNGADGTIDADQLVATAHQTLATSLNLSSQEFAEQLARVVAEAAGSGGPGQVTVSIAPSAKLDEAGTVSVSIPEYEDSTGTAVVTEDGTVVFSQEENANSMITHQLVDAVDQMQGNEIVTDEHGNQTIVIKTENGENIVLQQDGSNLLEQGKEDSSGEVFAMDADGQQVLVEESQDGQMVFQQGDAATEEFVAQLARNQAENNQEGVQMELGEDSQNQQIVMMVDGEEGQQIQQIQIPGGGEGQPYTSAALLKIPTADGGHQMLIIPISSGENGSSTITLPQGYTLGNDDADGNITLQLDPNQLPLGEDGEPQQLMLPVDADGQINLESLLQSANAEELQTEN